MAGAARWWSQDPDKAAAERLVVAYTPVWIGVMGVVMLSGVFSRWGDLGLMLLGCGLAAPLLLLPLLRPGPGEAQLRAWQRSSFRLNLWIAIYVFVGSYFLTHYFFDLAGMRYGFPTSWNLQATLVGHSGGEVPLFLYPLTQAYFMSYHVCATVLLRALSARFSLGRVGRGVVIVTLAYGLAFAETFFMAIPALSEVFSYTDRTRMLTWGSIFYGTYFVISLPAFARIDEQERWTLGRTLSSALAVGMAVFIALDLWASLIGSI